MHPATPMPPQRPFPPIQHHWVADERSRAALTGSVIRAMLWNPAAWVLYGVITALVAFQFVLSIAMGIFSIVVFGLTFSVVFAGVYWYTRRAVRAIVPVGAPWATGFGPDGLVVVSPMATTVLDYSAIVSARRSGEVIVCRLRGDALYELIPGILVSDQELQMLRSRTSAR